MSFYFLGSDGFEAGPPVPQKTRPRIEITEGILRLVGMLLDAASDRWSNDSCEDLDPEMEAALTREEWDALAAAFYEWDGDPEEFEPGEYLSLSTAASVLAAYFNPVKR